MIVFINKLDREGKDGVELLDEIEQKLKLRVVPLTWPVGMGQRFQGVYSLYEKRLVLFRPHGKQEDEDVVELRDLESEELEKYIGKAAADELREELEVITTVYPDFNPEDYRQGKISPVFFGSAINNFGVRELLDCFVDIAPSPLPRVTEEREVMPEEDVFSGFVFKIHANMDPRHRDRIAFVRVCSGKFERNTNYRHIRLDRTLKFSNPTAFMAEKKAVIDEAFPGDIVGLHDTGNFKIGDSLTEGEVLTFKGIPSFSPEQFRYVINRDPMRYKQLAKGLDQLMDEGVAQLFTKEEGGRQIIGTVGALQFDVIQYRLKNEYGASCEYEPLNIYKACWISSKDEKAMKEFVKRRKRDLARDKDGKLVYLAETAWNLKMIQEKHPEIQFHFKSEF